MEISKVDLYRENELLKNINANLKIKIIELENKIKKGGCDELKQRYNDVLDKIDILEEKNKLLQVENECLKVRIKD